MGGTFKDSLDVTLPEGGGDPLTNEVGGAGVR